MTYIEFKIYKAICIIVIIFIVSFWHGFTAKR